MSYEPENIEKKILLNGKYSFMVHGVFSDGSHMDFLTVTGEELLRLKQLLETPIK